MWMTINARKNVTLHPISYLSLWDMDGYEDADIILIETQSHIVVRK